MKNNNRRSFLGKSLLAASTTALASCDKLNRSDSFQSLLDTADVPTEKTFGLLTTENALSQEFTEADISPVFKANGSVNPKTPEYLALLANQFADYRLKIYGLVSKPMSLSLDQLRALPSRTQITRHDCVEGWSCIGKWKGTPLGKLLDRARPLSSAKYLIFHCADSYHNDDKRYYESIYLSEAYHPQSILAYEMNDKVLDVAHGAPLRVRLERKLGYKMAKYILGIELLASLDGVGAGKGGFWEDDQGYQWHGGI
jgi:DMSO/TMAO reductase YedYZ molybdopterin-dependent catalytic subunit